MSKGANPAAIRPRRMNPDDILLMLALMKVARSRDNFRTDNPSVAYFRRKLPVDDDSMQPRIRELRNRI